MTWSRLYTASSLGYVLSIWELHCTSLMILCQDNIMVHAGVMKDVPAPCRAGKQPFLQKARLVSLLLSGALYDREHQQNINDCQCLLHSGAVFASRANVTSSLCTPLAAHSKSAFPSCRARPNDVTPTSGGFEQQDASHIAS